MTGSCDLDEGASRYVARVHRMRAGDRFVAFDPEQVVEADATIIDSRRGRVRCEVGELRSGMRCTTPAWLMLGVCKGDRFEWAIREATALGVTDIVPTICARSASSVGSPDRMRMDRWRKIVVEGARQSGRGDVPVLHEPAELSSAIKLAPAHLSRVCFWERGTASAAELLRGASRGVVVLVGPEGGLEEDEAGEAVAGGFVVASLGELVLRTETAVVAVLGAWRLLTMEVAGVKQVPTAQAAP